MDKDQVKGKVKDIAGRAERQAGEWTGDQKAQAEGLKKQVEGKTQEEWGNLKDAAKRAKDEMEAKRRMQRTSEPRDVNTEEDREKGAA